MVDEASYRNFFHDILEVEGANEAELEALAAHAFPDLFFLDGVWDGLRHKAFTRPSCIDEDTRWSCGGG